MCLDHRHLHLRHQQVHVLTRIAHQRDALLVARKVVGATQLIDAEQELGRIIAPEQVRIAGRSIAVETLQVEPGAAHVADQRLIVMVGHR